MRLGKFDVYFRTDRRKLLVGCEWYEPQKNMRARGFILYPLPMVAVYVCWDGMA